jgi:hypothetical protein
MRGLWKALVLAVSAATSDVNRRKFMVITLECRYKSIRSYTLVERVIV